MPGPLDALRTLLGRGAPPPPPGPPMLSESAERDFPEMATAWAGRNIERPIESAQTGAIRPMNFLERALLPRAQGYTSPWGTIAYNKGMLQGQKADLGDFLTHELTHIQQQNRPGGGIMGGLRQLFGPSRPYQERDYEQEAFLTESQRPVIHGDINLPRGPRSRSPLSQ